MAEEIGKVKFKIGDGEEKSLDKKFVEFGDKAINLYLISTIEKVFEIPDNGGELDRFAFTPKYGIVINKNSYTNELKEFYQNYEIREQRYIKILKALENLGAEIIKL